MTRRHWLSIAAAILVSLTPLAAAVAPVASLAKENARANYDIRDDRKAADVIERYKEKAGKQRIEKIKEKKEKIHGAVARVQREIPGLAVAFSEHTGGPELVGIERGRQKLTGRNHEPRDKVARGFLQKNADLYGLSPKEVAQLRKTADYANPSGNLGWVEYKQELNGLPVFRGDVRFAVTTDGEIVQSTGNLVPALEDFSDDGRKDTSVTADAAVVTAAASVGVTIAPVLKDTDGTTYLFEPGPFTDDIKVQLEYFPLDSGIVTLAWSMILWQEDAAFYTYISAEGGELLWRKNIANEQVQPATYGVYDGDSPAPLSPSNATPGSGIQGAAIPRTLLTRVHEHPSNNNGWMTDGTSITTGNNVDAGMDLLSPNGIDAGSRATGTAFRVFDYVYNPAPGIPAPGESPALANYRLGEVTQMFFWTNRYHDRLYEVGFTEAARNFQLDNFGRGGAGNDRVLAEGQDFSGTNNANFFTPPDGSSGRMQMYIFTGPTPDRTSGLDQEIVIHELTHGTSNRLHNNAAGLTTTMSGGMGEGWSDFYARVLLSTPDEDVNGVYAMGGYSTLAIVSGFTDNYYYGIRRFPHSPIANLGPNGKPHNPLTFADLDPTQINLTDGAFPRGPIGSGTAFQVHNIGEIWCAALLEVRARIITRLGWAVGNQLMLQLTTDGMKLDPVNPTLLQGRNAILAANFASVNASGATELDIWRGFAARGMGFSASAVSSSSSSVVEAFDIPNVSVGAVTIVSDDCDNGGVADPGETVVLSIPFTNPYQLNDINDGIVTVGATTIALGALAAGQTVTHTFPVTIPSTASCGIRYDVPISVTSTFGTTTRTASLQVGFPTSQVPEGTFSSGNVSLPIVDQQTTDIPIVVTGSGAVGRIRASLRLNHTFDGDLVIRLVAPNGASVILANSRGGSGDNFGSGATDCSGTPTTFDDAAATAISGGIAPFAGTFRPDQPLSGLNGLEMNGVWKLRISDIGDLDLGTAYCATLEINEQLYFCCGVAGTPIVQAVPPPVLVEECASAANGAPDPGEIVTMSFPLRNVGSGLTTNLVATLQNSGGVTSLSGPQSYGVVSPVGSAVARDFELAISTSAVCGSNVVATFDLTDNGNPLGSVSFDIRTGATVANTYSFASAASIQIPATGTGASTGSPANPYPSSIAVSGVAGTVVGVALTLHGFSHTFPGDVDLLLVGPGGQKFVPLSDLGGSNDVVNLTITLDDAAAAALPSTFVSGTFRPGNSGASDPFPAPAPAAPYASPATAGTATFASVFGGSNPNGTW
ncbi:MAG TPA: M36 family metallopeptidase [Thermoanaerobaculia bacterium]|nr:M36 family metallopeptidase [Thermoanaerobaculia bacterium]